MLLKLNLHFRVLVGGVIIRDEIQLKILGLFAIDLFEKLLPLLMTVLSLTAADQASLKITQRSEQGDRDVADIVMRLRKDMSSLQRQIRLRALQGLNLVFLIAAEYLRLIRRVEIQPDHIPKLFFEMRIIGQFECVGQVRFQVIGGPVLVHASGRDPATRAILLQLY